MTRLALAAALVFAPIAFAPAASAGPADAVVLAPHRAVYDLKLSKARGNGGIQAVRGRILYDFSGSACEGYALSFRQVSSLDSGEGKSALSDLRATTWEDGQAKKFQFKSENLLNEKATETVDGRAERTAKTVDVNITKPKSKSFKMAVDYVFPTEHMRRIVAAAREGKTVLELPVYDGSETGEKLYQTLTVIGRPIAAGEKPVSDAGAKVDALKDMRRWPVTISYFERKDDKAAQAGEQTPVYAISFELYENGISRALTLDYNDFVITGEMTSLDLKKAKDCK